MTKPTECIFSYADGSVYMGHMVNGKRHGRGTLRTAAFVYSSISAYTQENAVENAHCAKWHEYIGNWSNDEMHGCGCHLWKSGDGGEVTLFQGEWENGRPQRQRRPSSESVESVEPNEGAALSEDAADIDININIPMAMSAEMETSVFGY
jgi:hypothetical protein